ncbi:DUF2125 domain-containing protein [Rhizobiaceae bacterium BDR2-2]|uniref:DUF2125 domain-containing protein n=1 Tax=Ectorhizobium quercum TaxID=2965071 RepID=A0AAE3N3E4_9HYPH|nr:DUF2125 domain-containing protein [Ectorhizobium quercum]MCX8999192.1 DUF2125 domain-containing protein [Ectorhizobium quercum]
MEVTQPAAGGKASGRKWLLAVGALAALAAVYAGGWHLAASHLRGKLLAALAGQDDRGRSIDCRRMTTGGFPFSMTLNCSALEVDDVEHGISTTLGPAEARISMFSPDRVRSTFSGPAEIRSVQGLLVSEWSALASEVGFGLNGMQSIRVEADALKTNFTDPGRGNGLQATANRFTGSLDGESGDLVAGVTVEEAKLARNGVALPLPPLTVDAALTVDGRGDLAGRLDRQALYGTNGEIRRFAARLGEGRDIVVTGPFSVDDAGRISGKFRIEAKNVAAWIEAAQQALPEAAPLIETVGSLIRSYTKGDTDLSLDLTVRDGQVFVAGFIPVGEIPPL